MYKLIKKTGCGLIVVILIIGLSCDIEKSYAYIAGGKSVFSSSSSSWGSSWSGSTSSPMEVEVANIVDVQGNVGVYNINNVPLYTSLKETAPWTTFTKGELYMNEYFADVWFTVILVWLLAIANFLMLIVFLLRIVILWILLILSPFLLVLALLFFSKSLFKTWGWVYLRWILIGPLLAMGLGIIVYIWQFTGIPIQSLVNQEEILISWVTNLSLSAPYHAASQISTNHEVMKIVIAILMLYAVIFLPFWLTRKSAFVFVSDKLTTSLKFWKETTKENTILQESIKKDEPQTGINALTEGLKSKLNILKLNKFLDNRPALATKTNKTKAGYLNAKLEQWSIEPKSSLDSEKFDEIILNLDTTTLAKVANLTPLMNPKRNNALSELAEPNLILNETRQQNIKKLMREFTTRASNGDQSAQKILDEVKNTSNVEYTSNLKTATMPVSAEEKTSIADNRIEAINQSPAENKKTKSASIENVKAKSTKSNLESHGIKRLTKEKNIDQGIHELNQQSNLEIKNKINVDNSNKDSEILDEEKD